MQKTLKHFKQKLMKLEEEGKENLQLSMEPSTLNEK